MRVALADDSRLFRDGLQLLLDGARVSVTSSCRDGEQLLAAVTADPPDVVVLDVRMPPTFTEEGLETAEEIRRRWPRVAVLVLSAYVDPSAATRLLAGGGQGIGLLSKDKVADVATLVDALTRLARGETVIDQEVVAHLFDRPARTSLTEREQQVLTLMAEGRTNLAIAAALHLSERTVEAHIAAIFDKLGIPASRSDNRRVLAVLAWLHGGQR